MVAGICTRRCRYDVRCGRVCQEIEVQRNGLDQIKSGYTLSTMKINKTAGTAPAVFLVCSNISIGNTDDEPVDGPGQGSGKLLFTGFDILPAYKVADISTKKEVKTVC